MRGVKDLQYRFLNATNWKCKTALPRDGLTPAEFREQDFLRKLSKGRMDPLDSMLGLVRLTDVQPNAFSDLAVTRHQAQRMLDNPVAHGELFHALSVEIDRSSQAGYGGFLREIKENYETLVKELMARAGYKGKEFKPVVDEASSPQLVQAMERARGAIITADRRDHAVILQKALVEAKDEKSTPRYPRAEGIRRAARGSQGYLQKIQRDPAQAAHENDDKRSAQGRGRCAKLDCAEECQVVDQSAEAYSGKSLPPLLEAMSDVIDGTGSAKHDLKRALDAVKRAAKHTQQHIIRLDNLAVSIAMQELRTDTEFVQLAEKHLRSLTYEARMRYLTQADTKPTISVAPLLQTAVQNLANEAALDLINQRYLDYTKGEDLNAVCQKIRALDDDSLIVIAWFFDRNPWIPAYFDDLAAKQPNAQPLSAIINEFGNTASKRLGYENTDRDIGQPGQRFEALFQRLRKTKSLGRSLQLLRRSR